MATDMQIISWLLERLTLDGSISEEVAELVRRKCHSILKAEKEEVAVKSAA